MEFKSTRRAELREVRDRLRSAELQTFDEGKTTCCYSEADKTWTIDPAGVAWETYRVMADAEVYGVDRKDETPSQESACCAPKVGKVEAFTNSPGLKKSGACCG